MKLYFAGPLFTTPERQWNAEVTAALRAAGHEVFLPQEQEPGKDGPGVFATDVGGIDWADGLVAIIDGPDPDAGTSWEVGYAFGKKPIVLVRTDFRSDGGEVGEYNPMLTQAATIRLDLPAASTTEVVSAFSMRSNGSRPPNVLQRRRSRHRPAAAMTEPPRSSALEPGRAGDGNWDRATPDAVPGVLVKPFVVYRHQPKRCNSVIGGTSTEKRGAFSAWPLRLRDLCGGVWSVRLRHGKGVERRREPFNPPPPPPPRSPRLIRRGSRR